MQTALYIHFPFCVRKCLYCDFNSLSGSEIPRASYTDSLIREMDMRRASLTEDVFASTLYLGGGTPSLLEPFLVERLIETARRLYGLTHDAEITIEANPGTVDSAVLAAFHSAGVNRLSLGIQSFSEDMLTRLGRVHTAGEGIASFSAAREAGFGNIGIDLIHSLPGQTLEMWHADLDRAVALAWRTHVAPAETGPAAPEAGWELEVAKRSETDAPDGTGVLVQFTTARYRFDGAAWLALERTKISQAELLIPAEFSAGLPVEQLAEAWVDYQSAVAAFNRDAWERCSAERDADREAREEHADRLLRQRHVSELLDEGN